MIALTSISPHSSSRSWEENAVSHCLSDMLFLRAAYFLSRDIEKNGQDLIRVAIGRRNPYQLKHDR